MKPFFLILTIPIIGTLFPLFAYSQNHMIDSLESSLQNHLEEDSVRVHILIRIAEELQNLDNQRAMSFAEQALSLANKINQPTSVAKAYVMKGKVFTQIENEDSARYYFKRTVEIAHKYGLTKWQAGAMSEWGILEFMSGNYEKALEIFQDAVPLAEKSDQKSLLAAMYTNMAGIFFQQEDYAKALTYEFKGYKLIKEDPDFRISSIEANIGQEYGALGNDDSAIFYIHLSINSAFQYRDSAQLAYTYTGLADQFRETGKVDSAMYYYNSSLDLYNRLGFDGYEIGTTLGGMGDVMLIKKNYKAALGYYMRSQSILEEANYPDQLEYTLKGISDAYAGLGDNKNALEYMQKYTALHDTLNAAAKSEATARLERKFSLAEKEKEIQLLNKDKLLREEEVKQQRLLKNIFIGGAVALLLIAFLLFNRYQIKQRAAKQLSAQNKIIEAEKQRAEKEKHRAEQSEQFKSQFLANMSHEIRTPMNSISGFTNLLFDEEEPVKRMQYLTAIKKSSDNLLVVINDVLDLSKLQAGKMQLEKTPFRICEVLNFIYETFESKASEKKIGWKVEVANDVPEIVTGDPARVTQVLMNLVGNAIKFTDQRHPTFSEREDGSASFVLLHVRNSLQGDDEKGNVVFTVQDTGTGIPKDQIEKIFESFAQSSQKGRHGGTGLGLTISKNFVELMGGILKVESEEGKGSTFSFSIPFEMATEEQWQHYQKKELIYEEDLGEALRGIKILVAEDNEYNQLLINDTLKKFIPDLNIRICRNGKEVIDELLAEARGQISETGDQLFEIDSTASQFNLILMDVQMPEMDGFEATKVIREDIRSSIPIIALTASVIRSDIEKCLAAGMDNYVPKPFSAGELLMAIALALGKQIDMTAVKKETLSLGIPSVKNSRHQWIRLDHLHQLVNGDPHDISRYLNLFIELIPMRMGIIKEALTTNDYATVRQTVHAMKPQLTSLGLMKAKKLAESIEWNFHREDRLHTNAEELLQECSAAVKEVREELGIIS